MFAYLSTLVTGISDLLYYKHDSCGSLLRRHVIKLSSRAGAAEGSPRKYTRHASLYLARQEAYHLVHYCGCYVPATLSQGDKDPEKVSSAEWIFLTLVDDSAGFRFLPRYNHILTIDMKSARPFSMVRTLSLKSLYKGTRVMAVSRSMIVFRAISVSSRRSTRSIAESAARCSRRAALAACTLSLFSSLRVAT
ncbi:hypothetical protein ES705_42257 [subsurface metagenome]